jgi:uncharacterized protein (DUF2252 family)
MPPRHIACLLILATFALTACDRRHVPAARINVNQPVTAADKRLPAQFATDDPYDILAAAYAPFTSNDPLGFPMKARNLSTSAYRFWRGSKELFYVWCATHTLGWLADDDAYLRIHGDLHLGNMGAYPAAGGPLGRSIAFGAVDFDDSARLPFQLELLEGVVTFHLLAHERQVKLDADKTEKLIATMLDAYKTALRSDRTSTQLLEDDPWVSRFLKEVRKREYPTELERYTRDDHLITHDKPGVRARERLQVVTDRAGLPEALADALAHPPDARALFGDTQLPVSAIRDVARRTKLESAGSEGLQKYLVLVNAPAQTFPGGRAILYLKQEIPSAAERVGLIPTDPRPPGQRCAQDAQDLQSPALFFNSWCTWRDASFRVTLREPWSETFDAAMVENFDDLRHTARIWGTLAGCLHRQGKPKVEQILARLTPELPGQLRGLAATYATKVTEDHHRFDHDARTKALIKQAEAALKAME